MLKEALDIGEKLVPLWCRSCICYFIYVSTGLIRRALVKLIATEAKSSDVFRISWQVYLDQQGLPMASICKYKGRIAPEYVMDVGSRGDCMIP